MFDYSLRLAPSFFGVAAASQILCISTALNKRKLALLNCLLYFKPYTVLREMSIYFFMSEGVRSPCRLAHFVLKSKFYLYPLLPQVIWAPAALDAHPASFPSRSYRTMYQIYNRIYENARLFYFPFTHGMRCSPHARRQCMHLDS